jgi:serine/threonine-protein kinase
MKILKELAIFTLGAIVGIGITVAGHKLHNHINFAQKVHHVKDHMTIAMERVFSPKVRAARLENIVAPAAYFPPGAIWTQDISHAPVDPQSSAIITWLAGAGGWGNNNKMQIDFSIRVLQANATTPLVPFRKAPGFYAADSDLISTIPLPAGGGLEGQTDYRCPVDGDCHLLVVDRGHSKLYEAYQANYADTFLTATFVAVWDLNRIYPPSGRGEQCTSADAAGFPIAPLLFNADELAVGRIDHAIRFTLPNPRIRAHIYVHPATHAGAPRGPVTAPPMGARFRLKASYDLSQLTPAAQVVARAMQKYGMFLADGGNIALTAQNDTDTTAKYTDMDFGPHDLSDLKVTDFEIVDMGTSIRRDSDCARNK